MRRVARIMGALGLALLVSACPRKRVKGPTGPLKIPHSVWSIQLEDTDPWPLGAVGKQVLVWTYRQIIRPKGRSFRFPIKLSAYGTTEGKRLWSAPIRPWLRQRYLPWSYETGTAITDRGRWVLSAWVKGNAMRAVHAKTGKDLWTLPMSHGLTMLGGRLASLQERTQWVVDKEGKPVPTRLHSLVVLDPETARTEREIKLPGWAKPPIIGLEDAAVAVVDGERLIGLDLSKGKTRWSRRLKEGGERKLVAHVGAGRQILLAYELPKRQPAALIEELDPSGLQSRWRRTVIGAMRWVVPRRRTQSGKGPLAISVARAVGEVVVGLDAGRGRRLWKAEVAASACLSGSATLYCRDSAKLVGIDLAQGRVRWSRAIEGNLGAAWAAGGRLLLPTSDGFLVIDGQTGKRLLALRLADASRGLDVLGAVGGHPVLHLRDEGSAQLLGLSPNAQDERWRHALPSEKSQVAITSTQLVVYDAARPLRLVDPQTGKETASIARWMYARWLGGGPVQLHADAGAAYLLGTRAVVCLDLAKRRVRFARWVRKPTWIGADGDLVVLRDGLGRLQGWDRATGKVRWSIKPAAKDAEILLAGGRPILWSAAGVEALDPKTGKVAARSKARDTLALVGGRLIAMSSTTQPGRLSGVLEARRISDGKRLWVKPVAKMNKAQTKTWYTGLLAEGDVLVWSDAERGCLRVFDIATGRRRFPEICGLRLRSPPIRVGDDLFALGREKGSRPDTDPLWYTQDFPVRRISLQTGKIGPVRLWDRQRAPLRATRLQIGQPAGGMLYVLERDNFLTAIRVED